MDNFILTCNIVLPVFFILLGGQLCRNLRILREADVASMNKLTFRILLPLSLFKSTMQTADAGSINYLVIPFGVGCILAVFILGMLIVPKLFAENSTRGVLAQNLFRSNAMLLGLSLIDSLYPQGDGGIAAMMCVVCVPLFNVLAVFALEYFRDGRHDMKKVFIHLLHNPLIWGCLTGLALRLLSVELPDVVESAVSKVAGLASPFALLMIGASIDVKKVSGNLKALIFGLFGRLLLVPAVFLTLAVIVGFRGAELAALMIVLASPCAVSSYTMAAEMGGNKNLAAQMVAFSTIFSAFSLFLIIYVLKHFLLI